MPPIIFSDRQADRRGDAQDEGGVLGRIPAQHFPGAFDEKRERRWIFPEPRRVRATELPVF
jgi:hypothetical protein